MSERREARIPASSERGPSGPAPQAPRADSRSADDCDLCEAARLTEWYHEDDICWIAECEICAVPMVVWRDHGIEVPEAVMAHMMERLAEVADVRVGEFYVDDNMRNIPDHYHAHARPKGGFFGHHL